MASATYRHTVGMEDFSDFMKRLPRELRVSALHEGMKGAVKPIVAAAKRNAQRSVRTGALRNSITSKTKNYPHSGKCVGLVGPARGYFRAGKKLRKDTDRRGAESPSHYAHLVELGHHAVHPTKGSSLRKGTALPAKSGTAWVPAKPFLRPAAISTVSQQSKGFYAGIKKGIEKVIAKGIKAGTHVA
jgi:bacteriophage HK97-gp10 putative tail-component